jgi:hypothetical protein
MKRLHVFWHILLGIAMVAVLGVVVMLLWNWLMPMLFGWITISFLQALGLLCFTRILFGGMGKHWMRTGMMKHHRNPIREKWMNMTPEEKKEFLKQRQCEHGFGRDFGCGFGRDLFNEEKSGKKD